MEKSILEPLYNFSNYDFLEMVDSRKKVQTTANEYEAMRQKIETALAPKRGRRKKESFDPAQILQVRLIKTTRISNNKTYERTSV